MLNTDYKILTSIVAEQLNKITGAYVAEDQTGFIRGRFIRDNIRTLMNIMAKVHNGKSPAVLVFLDVEKAFDRIEWVNKKNVMQQFELDHTLRNGWN